MRYPRLTKKEFRDLLRYSPRLEETTKQLVRAVLVDGVPVRKLKEHCGYRGAGSSLCRTIRRLFWRQKHNWIAHPGKQRKENTIAKPEGDPKPRSS